MYPTLAENTPIYLCMAVVNQDKFGVLLTDTLGKPREFDVVEDTSSILTPKVSCSEGLARCPTTLAAETFKATSARSNPTPVVLV